MKKIILLSALVLASMSASAQTVWNKEFPFGSSRPYMDARVENGRFLITFEGEVLEMDLSGKVTGRSGRLGHPLGFTFINFVKPNPNPTPLGRSFVLLTRKLTAVGPAAYEISLFKPAEGLSVQLSLADSLGSGASFGPAFVDINAQSFWVMGHEAYRQITINDQSEVVLDWEKPLNLPAQAVMSGAVLHNNQVFAVSTVGDLMAFDLNGNLLWSKSNGFIFRDLAVQNNGLMACGIENGGTASLVKFDFDGNVLWSKTYADLEYNSVCASPNGSVACTGKSADNQIALRRVDGNGNDVWHQTYQNGFGTKVIAAPKGGFFLLGFHQGKGYAIKTDVQGETGPLEKRFPVRERSLRNSGLSVTQMPNSALFFNELDEALQLPADSATSPIFVHTPWLAGLDAGQNLYVSASTNGFSYANDYRSGLVYSTAEDFNRLWAVSREEIQRLRLDFGTDSELDESPPFDLLTWPAKGNPHFVQNLDFSFVSTHPDSLPAPFVDINGDGQYNVFEGDYPLIKGDQMLWWAITDKAEHQESNGQLLGVDILISLYAYDCPQNSSVAQTLFADYQVTNRRSIDYKETFFGFHTDFDLGCEEDDRIGSLPETNSYYVYNEDAEDGNPGGGCSSGAPTFGENIPIQTVTFLDQPLDYLMYFNRSGVGGSSAAQLDPTVPIEYYNYLSGHWRDGTPLTRGGSGYQPSNPNAPPTNFAFPDNPSDPQGWTMCSANLPQNDWRMISSHGPFDLGTSETFSIRLAFIFHPDIPHPCPDVDTWVKPTILQIQQWHDYGRFEANPDLAPVQVLPTGQSITLDATLPFATAYAWSTGASTSSIVVNTPGEYTVSITRAFGCELVETVRVKAVSSTATPTLPTWNVSPNPANDVLQIDFDGTYQPLKALIYNAQGQLVRIEEQAGTHMEVLVADLPPGVYGLAFWQDGKFLGSQKVVVQR